MISRHELDEMVERITIDAYGDEGYAAFAQAFEDEGAMPVEAELAGMKVVITGVVFDGHEQRGLVAVINRDAHMYRVSLLDIVFSSDTPSAVLAAAYRHWLGLSHDL